MEMHLNDYNFDDFLERAGGPVVVDFCAPRRTPCRNVALAIARLEAEHPEVAVANLNVDQDQGIARRYGIHSVPTVIRFDGGEPSAGFIGVVRYEHMLKMLGIEPVAAHEAA